MTNVEAGILILMVVQVLIFFVQLSIASSQLRTASRQEDATFALTRALTALTDRAERAESLSTSLIQENRRLIDSAIAIAPDKHHREFLESQVERLQMAMASSADLAHARMAALVSIPASAAAHAQTLDRDPTTRSSRQDTFTEEPSPNSSPDPLIFPSVVPRRPGEARVAPPLDTSRFDAPDNSPYTPEEELAGYGLGTTEQPD